MFDDGDPGETVIIKKMLKSQRRALVSEKSSRLREELSSERRIQTRKWFKSKATRIDLYFASTLKGCEERH